MKKLIQFLKLKIIFLAVGIGILLLIILSFFIWLKINSKPVQIENHDFTLIEIKKGSAFLTTADELYDKKLIRSPLAAKIIWKIRNYNLKAGYYQISPSMRLDKILDIFASGKEFLEKLTIPEGLSIEEIGEVIEKSNFKEIKQEFLETVRDPLFLKKYFIPFDSAEGYLFPSTYLLHKKISGKELAVKMVDTFFEKAGESFKTLSPEKQKEVMILASIIEKEGKKDSERPIIASVFTNRLAKKILLESCATVIYAFEKKGIQKKRLLYRDLKIKSPFNTYLYPGLPPSPISSFGTVSLHAAMNPAETDYLYFVYKGNGEHIFTKTLKEHMAAYRQYILYQTQRK